MNAGYLALVLVLLVISAGCTGPAPETKPDTTPGVPAGEVTVIPTVTVTTATVSATTPQPTTSRETATTTATPSPVKTIKTQTTAASISTTALNAKISAAKIHLTNLKDTDVAGTIVFSQSGGQNCEIKKSRELGYLIDTTTGESTFVKGDYWGISADLFVKNMKKDRDYIIIHTHPKSWTTCGGTGIISLNTFSIGDLEAAASLTGSGYHIRELIAISDMDYVIYPKVRDDWRPDEEILSAVASVEKTYETKFSTYDKASGRTYYDVDNLMPLLARKLNYTYTANQNVLA